MTRGRSVYKFTALRAVQRDTILTAKAATGTGSSINASDFRNAVCEISTASSGSMTLKCQGSIGPTPADFTAAASSTNPWVYLQVVDLQNGTAANGATGVVYTGTDGVYLVEVNVNSVDWFTWTVTAYSAGNVTVKSIMTDNQ